MRPSNIIFAASLLVCLQALTLVAGQAQVSTSSTVLVSMLTPFNSYTTTADPTVDIPAPKVVTTKEGQEYRFIADIAYLGTSYPEKGDLYLPIKEQPSYPAILEIHGGGWVSGDKAQTRALCEVLVSKGYAVFSINYKLGDRVNQVKDKESEQPWPRNLWDCKTALRFMRAYATQLKVDPERIAVCGQSAGGHLAMMVGLSSNRPEYVGGFFQKESDQVLAIVDFFGIADMRSYRAGQLIPKADYEDAQKLAYASPVTLISPQSPPMLILHGEKDALVKISHAHDLVKALKANNVDYRFIAVPEGVHAFGITAGERNGNQDFTTDVIEFLAKHGMKTGSTVTAESR